MMKALLKFKWPISILLIIVIALSLIFSPNLSQLAKRKVKLSLRVILHHKNMNKC